MVVGGVYAIEKEVLCKVVDGTGWSDVKEASGSVESFDPKRGREMRLKEEGADDIICCVYVPLRFAILR